MANQQITAAARPTGPWGAVTHPRGSGFALMNEDGQYLRHPQERFVLCFSNRWIAQDTGDALHAAAQKRIAA